MNDIGVIHLTNGGFAVVDSHLWSEINQHSWHRDAKGYVCRVPSVRGLNRKQTKLKLHREVLNAPDGVIVDHRNRILIDNRISNLRFANSHLNGANRGKGKKKYSSQFKGVSWKKKEHRWFATIMVKGRSIHLGCFQNESDAALAYNTAAIKYFGEFAAVNQI